VYDFHINVRKSLYQPEVLLKAAYAFLDEAYIHFDEDAETWIVEMCLKDKSKAFEDFSHRFENELLSQAVRLHVLQRTHSIREMLLARAMTSTLVDEEDPISKIKAEQQDVSPQELDEILTDWFDCHE